MKPELSKFIYVAIPKTASKTIKLALQQNRDKLINGIGPAQKTAMDARKIFTDEDWVQYFKFTSVRNPWRRIWSNFCFRVQRLETFRDLHRLEKYFNSVKQEFVFTHDEPGPAFEDWRVRTLKNMGTIDAFFDAWGDYHSAFKKIVYDHEPQSDYFTNQDGDVIVDHLIDFNNLEKDFSFVCGKLNIDPPEKLKTENQMDYKQVNVDFYDFYNQELIDLVAEKDKKVIALKNYDYI